MTDLDAIRSFILAGKAIFTLENIENGNRVTYKVHKPGKDTPWFVMYLSGPDNETHYSYLGAIFEGRPVFTLTKKSPDYRKLPNEWNKSTRGFHWLYERVFHKKEPLPKFQFSMDFVNLVEYHASLKSWNYTQFKNCVNQARDKLTAIVNRSCHQVFLDSLWKRFYATTVVPLREKEFGDYLREEKRKRDERKQFEQETLNQWYAFFFRNIFINAARMNQQKESFEFLEISPHSSREEIMTAFRAKAMIYHPDHGGHAEDLQKLIEAKNICLAMKEKPEKEKA